MLQFLRKAVAPTVRISEETKKFLNEHGNTFDTPDQVIQRMIEEAGHTLPSESDSKQTSMPGREKTELEEALDDNIPNPGWLETRKLRDVVVDVAELTLEMSSTRSVTDRRQQAQELVLKNRDVKNIQTIQDQCGRRLFKGYVDVPNNRWTEAFDRILSKIESELKD